MAQADGYFPRINAEMLASGQYNDMIVSLVGNWAGRAANGLFEFVCSDGHKVLVDAQHADKAPDENDKNKVELVGQATGENNTVAMFITRGFSENMDLLIYNKMIAVQLDPKFQSYFQPV